MKSFKGISLLTACTFATLLFTGCGNTQPTQKTSSVQSQENSSAASAEPATPAIADKLSTVAGIGSKATAFKKDFGAASGNNEMLKNYENNKVAVVFVEERAINITISADKNHKRDKRINDMLPSDATNIVESRDDSDEMLIKNITKGNSELLKKACPDSEGNFIVISTFDKKTGNYIKTVIGTGNKQ